ncbi:MAG: 3-(methylsulfanyl)propanoyl-CoA dehydrogenase, partial [Pseudomonadota bacterium]|nr:3-(methylsulfanyl)propanoyl-CoA dehydrogenase [Pseudomonadota bacterium]
MLMSMRSRIEAMRALAYVTAAALDNAQQNPDGAARARAQAFADLMIPVVKGWSTEVGIDVASTGVQVHGGMGFIEETGAAQHLRDVRISTIYEGTTGIQANDLIGRKMAREGGATIKAVIGMMRQLDSELAKQGGEHFAAIRARFTAGINELEKAATWIVENYGKDVRATSVGAVPFLWLFGIVAGGWQMARAALVAQARIDGGDQDPFFPAKIITTRFFADHQLTRAAGLAVTVMDGAAGALALEESMF